MASHTPDTTGPRPAAQTAPRWITWADSWRAILLLVLLVTLARVLYLFLLCPYDLVQDEAHYWEWSRRLDWSYYSKGPGVAWLIAMTTALVGTTEAGVRLGAALAGGVASLGVGALAVRASGDRRAGFLAAALFNLAPVYQVSSLLMTIDIPYLACWALASLAAWHALFRGSRWAWVWLGLAIGAGFLFKYTMLLILPGLVGFVLLDRRARAHARCAWPWALLAVGLLVACMTPVFIWNAQHDWVTVRHLMGHLGMAGGDMPSSPAQGWNYEPKWTLELLGTQAALLGPVLPLLVLALVWAWRTRREGEAPTADARARRFLVWTGAPVLLIYIAVSFFTDAEGNWPIATYVTLTSLGGWTLADCMDRFVARRHKWRSTPPSERGREGLLFRRPESPARVCWRIALVGGLLVQLVLARADLAGRALDAVARGVTTWLVERGVMEEPVRHVVPLHRLTQGRALADHVAPKLQAQPGPEGRQREPFVIAQKYGHASLLAFYLPGRPVVYCSSSDQAGRKNQYDFWPDTSLDDLDALGGRPAICIGATWRQWKPAFGSVRKLDEIVFHEQKSYPVFRGRRYRGFPQSSDDQ